MRDDAPFSHLVVIGVSGKRQDALTTLISTLPSALPAPLLISVRLDTSRLERLRETLADQTALPVRVVSATTPLEAGAIFLLPSTQQPRITASAIELTPPDAGAASLALPSLDMLLASAAERFGERLIVVLLSGMDDQGVAGARTVKEAEGTVIAQREPDEDSLDIPEALAPTTVDIVVPLERIGPALAELLSEGAPGALALADERQALDGLLEEVRERYGIDFKSYKTPTILRRLRRRIVATDTQDLVTYRRYLHSHPEEYQHLINAFLIKVTEFFRDPDLIAYLRQQVIPDLIEHARLQGNELRIWSAGCATGEEAYSLAILVAEALGGELERFNVRIFATDVDAEAIAFARRGVYSTAELSNLPPGLVEIYFTRENGAYQVKKRLRALTVFGQHDLGQRSPFPRVDLVVCRNVLIYFTPDLQQRTLQLFAYSLRDGGYLVLGSAESASSLGHLFAMQHKRFKVYRRQGERILMPPTRFIQPLPGSLQQPSRPSRSASEGAPFREQRDSQQRARAANDTVLMRLPVGVVVVNRRYDIQMINGAARRFLGIHGQSLGEDLVHIAQGVATTALRAAIDLVFRTGEPTHLDEVVIEVDVTEEPRYFQFTFAPQAGDGEQGVVQSVLVVIEEVTALSRARRALEEQAARARDELATVRSQVERDNQRREQFTQRLIETNRQLTEANQELTGANEDLLTTNEELLLSSEEAQAASEEVETLNEELQATNEELETLNEELQATNEELETLNEELQARTIELQELARLSEGERTRLSAVLGEIADAVLVVNTNGVPILTNDAFVKTFGVAGAGFAPANEWGYPLSPQETPQQRAMRGETFRMEFTLVGADGVTRWFEANGQPVFDAEGRRQWGVIVIRDITERSLYGLQDELVALASQQLRTPLTPLLSSLHLLQQELDGEPADSPRRRYVESALEQARATLRLVDDLNDIIRLGAGTLQFALTPLQFDLLVTRMVDLAQALTGGQRLTLTVRNAPLVINGDTLRLQQALLNLLTSALRYAASSDQIEVRLRAVGDAAELRVRDGGRGIPAAELPLLFSRSYQATRAAPTTRERGPAPGLYLVQEIVRAHNGTITVESAEGQGWMFTLRIPLAPR